MMQVTFDADKLRRWAASPEGRKVLKRAVERAGKKADEFKRARIIDPDRLYRPITR